MLIEQVRFQNFRLLRDATLPLEPLTLLLGANGSGKSTVFEALQCVADNRADRFARARTFGVPWSVGEPVMVEAMAHSVSGPISHRWATDRALEHPQPLRFDPVHHVHRSDEEVFLVDQMQAFRVYDLTASRLAASSALTPGAQLHSDGSNLAAALDQLRDRDPERWRELNEALPSWIPEFDQVLFETPEAGKRMVVLRTRRGRDRVPAHFLSAGTRFVLGLLAITHGETETTFFGIEEPETGIHPRLLRNVYDALVRMAYADPVAGGPGPRQVIVTTHSPYLLDLFRDHPASVVVAERRYDRPVEEATFTRLSDRRDIDEIVSAGPLGEAWYTGVLGGVPALPGSGAGAAADAAA